MLPSPARALLAVAACLAAAAPAVVRADERGLAVPLLPKYAQECSACHVAYPPSLLPAPSWQRIVGDLPHHFGTDASLDAATVRELSAWLVSNAGTGRRAAEAPPQDRITQSRWFVRKHRDVPAATWKSTAVKSAANCAACHRGAEQGVFDEHDVRIPR